MAEYIDREAVKRALADSDVVPKYKADNRPVTDKIIDDISAADVAPVVRCKDCKWFADNNDGEWYGCQMFQVVWITPEDAPKPDDFCSYGERKDGGSDE